MLKKTILLTFLISIIFTSFGYSQVSIYNTLLQKYVDDSGNVNYSGLKKEKEKLESYITFLTQNEPKSNWSSDKTKAFWINVYNAYTLKLIIDHYPVKSINNIKKDGKKPWDIPFVRVGGKTYTLNEVEHGILRKNYDDPRIHVGVNCASFSCPKLYNKAFTEKNIDIVLTQLMRLFINDSKRNTISAYSIQISEIFKWFKDDFTKKGTLVDFLNQYSKVKISPSAFVTYKKYNWNLNGK